MFLTYKFQLFVLFVLFIHTSFSFQIANLKKDILRHIVAVRQGESDAKSSLLTAVQCLEEQSSSSGGDMNCIDGTWSLVYSTQAGTKVNSEFSSIVDKISSAIYKFFFRFLPALAGSSGFDENSSTSFAANIQVIDLASQTIKNTVTIRRPIPIVIVVNGECTPSASSPSTVDVVFTACCVGPIKLPLPRPKGSLKTTFCDGDLRIGRGGQGGLFIVKRIANGVV